MVFSSQLVYITMCRQFAGVVVCLHCVKRVSFVRDVNQLTCLGQMKACVPSVVYTRTARSYVVIHTQDITLHDYNPTIHVYNSLCLHDAVSSCKSYFVFVLLFLSYP